MTDLSPAAQAVLNGFNREARPEPHHQREAIAAALRAAADQVVPEAETNRSPCREGCVIGAASERIREELLAIAAELESATPDPLEPNDLSHLSEEEFQALAPQGYHGV